MYQVWIWWGLLSIIQIFNFKHAVWEYMISRKYNKYVSSKRALLYTSVCAFRTFLPRQDVSKTCLFDTYLSSIFIGRSLATIAEIAFIKQLYNFSNSVLNLKLSYNIVYAIYLAEVFSWLGTLTENQIFNTSEEITWTITISYTLYKNLLTAMFSSKDYMSHRVLRLYYISIIFQMFYIAGMLTYDIPNYITNWENSNTTYTIKEGFYRSLECQSISRDYQDWKIHIGWMTPYFTIAVWYSILMARYQSQTII